MPDEIWHRAMPDLLSDRIERAFATLPERRTRIRDRNLLAALDDRMLRTIGITRAGA